MKKITLFLDGEAWIIEVPATTTIQRAGTITDTDYLRVRRGVLLTESAFLRAAQSGKYDFKVVAKYVPALRR